MSSVWESILRYIVYFVVMLVVFFIIALVVTAIAPARELTTTSPVQFKNYLPPAYRLRPTIPHYTFEQLLEITRRRQATFNPNI